MLKHIRSPLPSPSPRLRNESLTGVLVGPFWGTRLGRRQSDNVISLYMPSRVVNCVFMSSRLPAVESPLPTAAGAAAMTPNRRKALTLLMPSTECFSKRYVTDYIAEQQPPPTDIWMSLPQIVISNIQQSFNNNNWSAVHSMLVWLKQMASSLRKKLTSYQLTLPLFWLACYTASASRAVSNSIFWVSLLKK